MAGGENLEPLKGAPEDKPPDGKDAYVEVAATPWLSAPPAFNLAAWGSDSPKGRVCMF